LTKKTKIKKLSGVLGFVPSKFKSVVGGAVARAHGLKGWRRMPANASDGGWLGGSGRLGMVVGLATAFAFLWLGSGANRIRGRRESQNLVWNLGQKKREKNRELVSAVFTSFLIQRRIFRCKSWRKRFGNQLFEISMHF